MIISLPQCGQTDVMLLEFNKEFLYMLYKSSFDLLVRVKWLIFQPSVWRIQIIHALLVWKYPKNCTLFNEIMCCNQTRKFKSLVWSREHWSPDQLTGTWLVFKYLYRFWKMKLLKTQGLFSQNPELYRDYLALKSNLQ